MWVGRGLLEGVRSGEVLLASAAPPCQTHVMQQLLQVLLQLAEVDGGDEAFAGLGQAVPGQLGHLVVDEAEDPVGQR